MAEDLFVFGPSDIVKRPHNTFPWSDHANFNNYMWVQMKARKISDQNTSGRGGTIAGGEEGATFIFLGPKSFGEQIGHEWSEYESMASRLANKVRDAAKLGGEIGSLLNANIDIGSVTNVFKGASTNFASSAEALTRKAYNAVAGQNIPKIKIDTPLYYGGSTRRELTLEFDLIAESSDPRDIKRDVLDVVQDLMRYSSPGISERSSIDIEFPYYFEVKTLPDEGVKYTTAALIAVQPTYGEPWIGGYPSQCKLNLTFKDISPLFRKTITHGSIINVIGGGRSNAARAAGEVTASNATAASSKKITADQKAASAEAAEKAKSQKEG